MQVGTSVSEPWFGIRPDTVWYNDMGTSAIQPFPPQQPIPQAPVGDMLTLVKTAQGEFVLTGSGDTLKLLMDYFLQSPEMWLRLAAMKGELEDASS